jgi:hypothetical protein
MITTVVGLPRPVQSHELFAFVESTYGIKLSEVVPRMIDRELRWFKLPKRGARVQLIERRLSVDSFIIRVVES